MVMCRAVWLDLLLMLIFMPFMGVFCRFVFYSIVFLLLHGFFLLLYFFKIFFFSAFCCEFSNYICMPHLYLITCFLFFFLFNEISFFFAIFQAVMYLG